MKLEKELMELKKAGDYNTNLLTELKKAVDFNTKLLEELTLTFGNNTDSKKVTVSSQMSVLKTMFENLPGIKPELKEGLAKIFDQAGGR